MKFLNRHFWIHSREQKKTQKALIDLAAAQRMLQGNLDALKITEKRLEILNNISATLFTSLELQGVFQKANHLVRELMSAEISLLFTLEEKNNELVLAASEGISS